MIQRIQSLYLLLVILLSCFVSYLSFNSSFEIGLNSWFKTHYCFFSIPLLGLLSLFIYNKRKIQSILCFVLIIINILVLHIYGIKVFQGNSNAIIIVILVCSFLECILLIMARKAINKDEKLVRSIDRIR